MRRITLLLLLVVVVLTQLTTAVDVFKLYTYTLNGRFYGLLDHLPEVPLGVGDLPPP